MLKDNYKYVQCCLQCLADGLQDIVPTILKAIADTLMIEVDRYSVEKKKKPVESTDDQSNLLFVRSKGMTEYGDFSEIVTSPLYHSTILLDLMINPLIRSRLLSTPTIQAVASMLDLCDIYSFPGAGAFINALLSFVESLSTNFKAL